MNNHIRSPKIPKIPNQRKSILWNKTNNDSNTIDIFIIPIVGPMLLISQDETEYFKSDTISKQIWVWNTNIILLWLTRNWELPHIIIKVLYIFGKKWEHVALRSSFRTYGYIMQAINNLRNSVFVSWPYFSHCYTNMSFFVFYRRVAWETRMSRWNISNGISI